VVLLGGTERIVRVGHDQRHGRRHRGVELFAFLNDDRRLSSRRRTHLLLECVHGRHLCRVGRGRLDGFGQAQHALARLREVECHVSIVVGVLALRAQLRQERHPRLFDVRCRLFEPGTRYLQIAVVGACDRQRFVERQRFVGASRHRP
jgi:hypothetical protein